MKCSSGFRVQRPVESRDLSSADERTTDATDEVSQTDTGRRFHDASMILSESRVSQLVESFHGRRIAVIGDVILDRYYRGTVSRISPEAPVPVVDIEHESEYPGGAANVAYNLITLGATPLLLGVIGNDLAGDGLRSLLVDTGIGDEGLLVDSDRPTTLKTRVIAASQHIVRVDWETKKTINPGVLDRLVQRLESHIGDIDALIIQDYDKGVVVRELIAQAVALARTHDVPVYVDPKSRNFFDYAGVTLFKPNRKEAEDALKRELRGADDRREGLRELLTRLQCEYVVLTLGSEGMMLARRDEEPILVPTKAIQVADVSGAGDTVIAALAAACAGGASMQEAVIVANHAAGIVCEQVGTVPVRRDELVAAMIDDARRSLEPEV